MGIIVVPLLEGLFAWILVAMAVSLYPEALSVFRARARQVWRRDAIVAAVVTLAAGAALTHLGVLLDNVFHRYVEFTGELFPATLATTWPAGGLFLTMLSHTILYGSATALAVFIVYAAWKRKAWWLWVGSILFLVTLGPTSAHSLGDFGAGWLENMLPILVPGLLVSLFLRDNILAYILVIFGGEAGEGLMQLFSQHNRFFLHNGIALALMVGIVLTWLLWPGGGQKEV